MKGREAGGELQDGSRKLLAMSRQQRATGGGKGRSYEKE